MTVVNTGKQGWSNSGGLITADPMTKVTCQANFEENPTNYTIQFGIQKAAPDQIIQPQAEVIWSVEGNSVRRLVNVVNGLSIMGTGQAVKISMWDNLRDGQGGFTPDEPYIGSVQVSPGSRASLDHPPTLIPDSFIVTGDDEAIYNGAVTLFPGGSVAFPITDNAGVVSVMPWFSGNSDVLDGDVYFNIGNNTDAYFEFNPARAPIWVPVTAACSRIFMRNDSASETITVGIVFGIDG
jgi:hypothetical protein